MVIAQTKFCIDSSHRHVTTILGFCAGRFLACYISFPAFSAPPPRLQNERRFVAGAVGKPRMLKTNRFQYQENAKVGKLYSRFLYYQQQ